MADLWLTVRHASLVAVHLSLAQVCKVCEKHRVDVVWRLLLRKMLLLLF
jgi:hypothetical protein